MIERATRPLQDAGGPEVSLLAQEGLLLSGQAGRGGVGLHLRPQRVPARCGGSGRSGKDRE